MACLAQLKAVSRTVKPTENDFSLINAIVGGNRRIGPDDVYVRELVVLGEEPTSHFSVHPERELHGKKLAVLSQIAALLPAAPMMEGHRTDKVPWGRIFKAAVEENIDDSPGKCITLGYYFVKNAKGDEIAENVDAGVYAEWSISYWFNLARCSICHKDKFTDACHHRVGHKDPATREIAYWYPDKIEKVLEVSNVYRGAYPNTKNIPVSLNQEESCALEEFYTKINAEFREENTQPAPLPNNNVTPPMPDFVEKMTPPRAHVDFSLAPFKLLPAGKYYVEPKYDGLWLNIAKNDANVTILTQDKKNITPLLPAIVGELRQIQANFLLHGILVQYKNGIRLKRADMLQRLFSNFPAGKGFKVKLFDVAWYNGENLCDKPLAERRTVLDALQKTEHVHVTKGVWVDHRASSETIMRAVENRKTSEGAIVKLNTMTLNKTGSANMWVWKSQYILNVLVTNTAATGHERSYECAVSDNGNLLHIGNTPPSKIIANRGDVVTVAVNSVSPCNDGKWSWEAPKLIAKKNDAIPDTIEMLRKIGDVSSATEKLWRLSDVVDALKKIVLKDVQLWVVGGLVRQGLSRHDVNLLTDRELTVRESLDIMRALGASAADVGFLVDANGPSGCSLKIETAAYGEWVHGGTFVFQEHGYGKKTHFDLRFGAPVARRAWGFTLFSDPLSTDKNMAREKAEHDPKWMRLDSDVILPGQDGHPGGSVCENARMRVVDYGAYEIVRSDVDFFEVFLRGAKLSGRYYLRAIVVGGIKTMALSDEVPYKDQKTWVFWRARKQDVANASARLGYTVVSGHLMVWDEGE